MVWQLCPRADAMRASIAERVCYTPLAAVRVRKHLELVPAVVRPEDAYGTLNPSPSLLPSLGFSKTLGALPSLREVAGTGWVYDYQQCWL